MSWELSSSEDNGVVRVVLTGVWPKADPDNLLVEIINEWDKGSHSNVLLCDLRMVEHAPNVGSDAAMSHCFARAGFNRIRKVAVLDHICHKAVDEVCELLISNRGCDIKFFFEENQDVYDWLLQ